MSGDDLAMLMVFLATLLWIYQCIKELLHDTGVEAVFYYLGLIPVFVVVASRNTEFAQTCVFYVAIVSAIVSQCCSIVRYKRLADWCLYKMQHDSENAM